VSDSDRIEDLEAVVQSLTRRIAQLESVVGSRSNAGVSSGDETADTVLPGLAPLRASHSQREPDAAPADLIPFQRARARDSYFATGRGVDLEGLVGRYGTLALATLTILAAVGSFLAWAMAHGLLVPWMRIVFGVLFAAALAFVGLRLRRRGEPRFGNILLALSLATIHVVAWALGPGLRLAPVTIALVVAAAASAALCVFAIRESDDDLLAVGFGGAYVAPFVTGDGARDPDVWLAAYGLIVFAAGVLATKGRSSRLTYRVVSAGAVLFALTLLYAPDVNGNPSLLSPLFALAASLAVIFIGARVAWRGFLRTTLAMLAAAALLVVIRLSLLRPLASVAELMAIVLAGLAIWASTFAFPAEAAPIDVSGESARAYAALDYTLLPLLLLTAAVFALPAGSNGQAGALCALWAGITSWLAHRSRDADSFEFLASGACIEAAAAPYALWRDRPELCIPALAVVAAAFGYAATRYPRRIPQAAAFILAALAFLWSIGWLSSLPLYTTLPFSSLRSFAAAAVVASAFFIVRSNRRHLSDLEASLPWAAGFVWIYVELARAISPDVSAFLLVAYFAGTGLAVLSAGTRRARPRLRQVGLGLALIAGLKALFEAGERRSILAKLGIYLIAGAYLLIVAYVYRKKEPEKQTS
jgi:hypothetical protein